MWGHIFLIPSLVLKQLMIKMEEETSVLKVLVLKYKINISCVKWPKNLPSKNIILPFILFYSFEFKRHE